MILTKTGRKTSRRNSCKSGGAQRQPTKRCQPLPIKLLADEEPFEFWPESWLLLQLGRFLQDACLWTAGSFSLLCGFCCCRGGPKRGFSRCRDSKRYPALAFCTSSRSWLVSSSLLSSQVNKREGVPPGGARLLQQLCKPRSVDLRRQTYNDARILRFSAQAGPSARFFTLEPLCTVEGKTNELTSNARSVCEHGLANLNAKWLARI